MLAQCPFINEKRLVILEEFSHIMSMQSNAVTQHRCTISMSKEPICERHVQAMLHEASIFTEFAVAMTDYQTRDTGKIVIRLLVFSLDLFPSLTLLVGHSQALLREISSVPPTKHLRVNVSLTCE